MQIKQVVVLIPAYNAAKTIESVVKKIDRQLVNKVIIVNDGSKDNSAEVLNAIENVDVVTHYQNKGYGATTKTLYHEALKSDGDYFVCVHADEGHDPNDIPKLLEFLESGEADIIVGARTQGIFEKAPLILKSRLLGAIFSGDMPFHKFIFNLLLTKFQNFCYGTNFNTFHSGYRACNRQALEIIAFNQLTDWYQYDTEFLVAAHEKNLKVAETPVVPFYSDDAGSSVPAVTYGLIILASAFNYWRKKTFS